LNINGEIKMTLARAQPASEDTRDKVFDMIKDIKLCMMVTQDMDGNLFARPMAAQEKDDSDQLWFFTGADTPKVQEIKENSSILLSYAESDGSTFVSLCGEASIVKDQARIEELWSESLKAWFPKGKTDPNICLIKVNPLSAEYWDQPSSKFVQAFGYIKGKVTGKPERLGENKTIKL
jgi:general stress protein 26